MAANFYSAVSPRPLQGNGWLSSAPLLIDRQSAENLKKNPKNTNGRLAIPAPAGLLVSICRSVLRHFCTGSEVSCGTDVVSTQHTHSSVVFVIVYTCDMIVYQEYHVTVTRLCNFRHKVTAVVFRAKRELSRFYVKTFSSRSRCFTTTTPFSSACETR